MRVAVVDIGTNSTRLLIADVAPGAAIEERVRESTVTRLGEGVDSTGRLGEAPQQRVFAAFERYAAQIREQRCEASAAVMTSAVRDAANGAEFSAAVQDAVRARGTNPERRRGGRVHLRRRDRRAAGGRHDRAGRDRHRRRLDRARLRRRRAARLPRLDADRRRASHRAPPALRPPAAAEIAALAAAVGASVAAAVPGGGARPHARRPSRWPGPRRPARRSTWSSSRYDTAKVEGHVLSRARLDGLLEQLAAIPVAERRQVARAAAGSRADDRRRHRRARAACSMRSASPRSRSPTATSSGGRDGARASGLSRSTRPGPSDGAGRLTAEGYSGCWHIGPGECRICRRLPPSGPDNRPPRDVPLPVLAGQPEAASPAARRLLVQARFAERG